jgi:hypothetical protein
MPRWGFPYDWLGGLKRIAFLTGLLAGLAGLAPACASMIDVIERAQTVIYAEIPNPSPEVMQALADAKGRGVHMGVITSPDDAVERRLDRFSIHFWLGSIDIPFVSVDGRQVFVYGQSVKSPGEANYYALRFLDQVGGVPTGKNANREANPASSCGSAWICGHTPGLSTIEEPITQEPTR